MRRERNALVFSRCKTCAVRQTRLNQDTRALKARCLLFPSLGWQTRVSPQEMTLCARRHSKGSLGIVSGPQGPEARDQGRRKWAQIRLEDCSCVGTGKHYKLWTRSAYLLLCFHDLPDSELALLIVVQVKGTAKDALDILQINDNVGSRGLDMVWQILDQSYAKLTGEKFDEAWENRDPARRPSWTENERLDALSSKSTRVSQLVSSVASQNARSGFCSQPSLCFDIGTAGS